MSSIHEKTKTHKTLSQSEAIHSYTERERRERPAMEGCSPFKKSLKSRQRWKDMEMKRKCIGITGSEE